jgi:hypothetical protein
VTADAEQVLDETVKGEKPLSVTGRCESTHLPLPLPGGLMGHFGAMVDLAVHAVCDVAEGGSHGSRVVAPEPVSNAAKRFLSLAMQ